MKVALIGPVFPYRGGIAHYTTSLANTLRAEDHQLLVVSFRRQYPAWLYPGDTDKDPSQIRFEVEDTNYWIDSLNPLTWLYTFWQIRTFAPQVIVMQWWTTFLAPVWFVLALLNKLYWARPLVFICHNVLPHEERFFDRLIVRLVLGLSSHVIVQSDVERSRLVELLPEAKLSIVPHPVYDIFVSEPVDRDDARKSLALGQEQFVLLFFGMIRAYKGLHELLVALSQVKRDYSHVKLIIAGEFWDAKQAYLTLITELGLDDVIDIEDRYIPNEEVGRYYAAADLLVAPYRRHTGSGVIQVAAALDLPVVTLNTLKQGAETHFMSPESPLFKQRVALLVRDISAHIQHNQNHALGHLPSTTCEQPAIGSRQGASKDLPASSRAGSCTDSSSSYHAGSPDESTWEMLVDRILEVGL